MVPVPAILFFYKKNVYSLAKTAALRYIGVEHYTFVTGRGRDAAMIDEKRMVLLNGLPQKIHIRGKGRKQPGTAVFTWRPGRLQPSYHLIDHADLANTFTVVAWDQRGGRGPTTAQKKKRLRSISWLRTQTRW